jgi:hypothetical protein
VAMPKRSRRRSAKPILAGSSPAATSIFECNWRRFRLPWATQFRTAGASSVLDWRVTFPPSLPMGHRKQGTGTNLPFRAFLPGCTHGVASRTERHAGVDCGATLGLRFNRQRTVHQFQSLLHADEAKTTALLCCFAVKARAGILNREMNLIQRSTQAHFELPYSTVFR